MKLLTDLLRNPAGFFQEKSRQRILIISLVSLFLLCIWSAVIRSAARHGYTSENTNAAGAPAAPPMTNTKWWLRNNPSSTPAAILALQSGIGTPVAAAQSRKCPAYAADFKPGIYGYISVFPPFENLVRSGAGTSYVSIGYIDAGDWVRLLDFPICTDDGYVWLKVHSAGSPDGWTAGGRHHAQWVILCSDPNKKCIGKKQVHVSASTPDPHRNEDPANHCLSDQLAIGLDAQIHPDDLLVVRQEPYSGRVLGHVSPAAVVTITAGPECKGGAVWWQVTFGELSGWAVENLLKPCPKEGECRPWE
jgi:hypothetical protein